MEAYQRFGLVPPDGLGKGWPARAAALAARVVLSLVFAYAGVNKILAPGRFARGLGWWPGATGSLANIVAIFLPWLEVVCAAAVLTSRLRRSALLLLGLLLATFAAVLVAGHVRGAASSCGCFSGAIEPAHGVYFLVGRDALLLALVAVAAWEGPLRRRTPP